MLLNWCEEITNIDPSINFRATGGWVKTVTGLDKSVLNGFSLVGEFVKASAQAIQSLEDELATINI